jgi:hypothetical protein
MHNNQAQYDQHLDHNRDNSRGNHKDHSRGNNGLLMPDRSYGDIQTTHNHQVGGFLHHFNNKDHYYNNR